MFIAGAYTILAFDAMTTVVNRLSANPLAILPIVLAVAGAMSIKSAFELKKYVQHQNEI